MSKKRIFIAFAIIGFLIFGVLYLLPQTRVLNGYVARTVCSCHFEVKRPVHQILKEDLNGGMFSLADFTINETTQSVTSTIWGFSPKTAVFRSGLGCLLLKGKDDYGVKFQAVADHEKHAEPWIAVDSFFSVREKTAISQLAFDPDNGMSQKQTRALLVLHKDQLIYEQYANGTQPTTPLLGWSMTKSILSTCAGILVREGKLKLDDRPFHTSSNAFQSALTLRDLLQMRSGLDWEEEYGKYSSATQMLFDSDNAFGLVSGLSFGPKEWEYSSGTTNLISGYIRSKFNDDVAYLQFPHRALFHVLDLDHAWIETDESGTYIASSYMYATAKDWLKLGRLYLRKGNWNGTQLIDSSWVNFVQQEATGSNGRYGGHFWLNKNGISYPSVPHDMFTMDGYQGQLIAIIPSKDLVIVRLGLADIDFDLLLKTIIDALEK